MKLLTYVQLGEKRLSELERKKHESRFKLCKLYWTTENPKFHEALINCNFKKLHWSIGFTAFKASFCDFLNFFRLESSKMFQPIASGWIRILNTNNNYLSFTASHIDFPEKRASTKVKYYYRSGKITEFHWRKREKTHSQFCLSYFPVWTSSLARYFEITCSVGHCVRPLWCVLGILHLIHWHAHLF